MKKTFKYDYEKAHYNRIDNYAKQIEQLYLSAIQEAANLGATLKATDKPFSFDATPLIKAKVEKIISKFTQDMNVLISSGTKNEWFAACQKSDALVDFLAQKTSLTPLQLSMYKSRNLEALAAFQQRKIDGLTLSDKVWKYTNQFKGEIEAGLDLGIGDGKSAAELSRDLRSYLQDPEKLFRRVRDKHGNLQLSKNAAKYHPGEGQYRSSYKNAMRLARTEINMAYRASDYEKNQQLDFVVGFRVVRSNHFFDCSVCDSLKGEYPKTFKFVGWHPHCRCHTEDILATEAEFINHQKKLIDGKESELKSVNEVSQVPNNYTKWVTDNKDRMMNAKNLPYFIADNSNVTPQIFINYSKAFSEQFTNKVSAISRNTGSVAVDTNIKKDERILKKAKDDYNGQTSMVKDIVRTTIIADEGSVQSVISEVGKQFDIYRIKNQLASVDPLGYSGTIINIRTSSTTFAEVQVNSALMIYGKEKNALKYLGEELYNRIKSTTKMQGGLGHGYYDEWRKLKGLNDLEIKRMKELEKISSEYYNKLRKFKI